MMFAKTVQRTELILSSRIFPDISFIKGVQNMNAYDKLNIFHEYILVTQKSLSDLSHNL